MILALHGVQNSAYSPAPRPMLLPKPLPRNGHIAVAAISSPGTAVRFDHGLDRLVDIGYRVTAAPNLTERSASYLAGDDERRAALLNALLRDDSWDALVFARGGYGAMRILDLIDWDALAHNPRPLIGFSDLTALMHAAWIRLGLSTFHGPMVHLDFADGLSSDRLSWFQRALAGESGLTWNFEPQVQVESKGICEGRLFGGCLSLIVSMLGTEWDGWIDDGILFWEEVGEPAYRIDRMLTQLDLTGRLRGIRGVLIGELKDCGGPIDGELELRISEIFGDRGIPVVKNLPFGHQGNNLLLPYGQIVRVDTSQGTLHFPGAMVDMESA